MLTLFLNLGVVCVDDYPAVGRAIASVAAPTLPVVMRVFDLQLVQSVIRTRFVERFSGLDPYSVLEFLKIRLAGVIDDRYFDKLPELRHVSNSCLIYSGCPVCRFCA